jgi:hypothetical protein
MKRICKNPVTPSKHLNRSIIQKQVEAAIKSFPMKKSPESDKFTAEFYQMFKDTLRHHKHLQ